MRLCCNCGVEFAPTGKSYRCRPCRAEYDRARLAALKLAGKPISGTPMPREYHRDYERRYYANPENRARRAKQMRGYAKAPGTREHHKARWQVGRAIQSGKLTREVCEVCGAAKVHAHHDDYSRPLDIRWLCPSHHRQHHAKARGETL